MRYLPNLYRRIKLYKETAEHSQCYKTRANCPGHIAVHKTNSTADRVPVIATVVQGTNELRRIAQDIKSKKSWGSKVGQQPFSTQRGRRLCAALALWKGDDLLRARRFALKVDAIIDKNGDTQRSSS